jgi:uncharacterized protein YdaU (DUF1376 family)
MTRVSFFKFYTADFLDGTRFMPAIELADYIRLLALIYDRGGKVPNDPYVLRHLLLCTKAPDAARRIQRLVDLGKLSVDDAGYLHNGRADREIEKLNEGSNEGSNTPSNRGSNEGSNDPSGTPKKSTKTTRTPARAPASNQNPDSISIRTSSDVLMQGTDQKSVPPKPTPRQELEAVLDAAHAQAVIDHRQRIRRPLTAHAAHLLAGKFGQTADPNGSADVMIANGWQGFDAKWLSRKPHAQQDTLDDYLMRRLQAEAEKENGHGDRTVPYLGRMEEGFGIGEDAKPHTAGQIAETRRY